MICAILLFSAACDGATGPDVGGTFKGLDVQPDTLFFTTANRPQLIRSYVYDAAGRLVPAPADYTIPGGPTTTAWIGAGGEVWVTGDGVGFVVGTWNQFSDTTWVISDRAAAAINIIGAPSLLRVGEYRQLISQPIDSSGMATPPQETQWSSSDPSVLTVDASGLLLGISEGVATLTATAGAASAAKVITVGPDSRIVFDTTNATVERVIPNDSVTVTIRLLSTIGVASAAAAVGTHTAQLSLLGQGFWSGVLLTTGLLGADTIVVRVTSTEGTWREHRIPVSIRPATPLEVLSPANGNVTNPVHIHATCSADCTISAWQTAVARPFILWSATSAAVLDTTLNVNSDEIIFRATAPGRAPAEIIRNVNVVPGGANRR